MILEEEYLREKNIWRRKKLLRKICAVKIIFVEKNICRTRIFVAGKFVKEKYEYKIFGEEKYL